MKSSIKRIAIGSVLVAAAAGFYLYLVPKPGMVTTDNAYVYGEVSQISAEITGTVSKVHVTDNQYVQVGELLAKLDPRDYIARKAQAESALAMVDASIVNMNQRIELQAIRIDEVATQIEAARSEAHLQTQEWKRFSNLLRKHSISRSNYDSQKTRMEQAGAALKASRLRHQAAQAELHTLESERQRLLAQREQANAALELAQLALEDTEVRAPISGVVGNRSVRTGRHVAPGTPLLAIVPVENIWVEANLKETQITDVHPGQAVEIELDGFPDEPFKGRVLSVAPATGANFSLIRPDNATGNFVKIVQRVPVRISLELPEHLKGRVVPGLSAEVAIDTRSEA